MPASQCYGLGLDVTGHETMMKRISIAATLLGLAATLSSAPVFRPATASAMAGARIAPTVQDPPAGRGQGGGRIGGRGQGRGARTRKAVLAWADTRNGIAQHDSVSHALAVIERLGYESGLYDTYIRTDSNVISKHPKMTDGKPASGGPDLTNVDAIFFLGHRDVPLDAEQKRDLLSFVKDDGKGFVAAHTATTAFLDWPEFGEMIGARYDGHPWNTASGSVITEDGAFPATRHLAPVFTFTDEFYQAQEYSREKIRVLLRLDVSRMPPNADVHRTDGDFPLAWARTFGKGRVFYSALGHAASTWDNPDVYHMYFEALKWSLGLTEADVTPRPLK